MWFPTFLCKPTTHQRETPETAEAASGEDYQKPPRQQVVLSRWAPEKMWSPNCTFTWQLPL